MEVNYVVHEMFKYNGTTILGTQRLPFVGRVVCRVRNTHNTHLVLTLIHCVSCRVQSSCVRSCRDSSSTTSSSICPNSAISSSRDNSTHRPSKSTHTHTTAHALSLSLSHPHVSVCVCVCGGAVVPCRAAVSRWLIGLCRNSLHLALRTYFIVRAAVEDSIPETLKRARLLERKLMELVLGPNSGSCVVSCRVACVVSCRVVSCAVRVVCRVVCCAVADAMVTCR